MTVKDISLTRSVVAVYQIDIWLSLGFNFELGGALLLMVSLLRLGEVEWKNSN